VVAGILCTVSISVSCVYSASLFSFVFIWFTVNHAHDRNCRPNLASGGGLQYGFYGVSGKASMTLKATASSFVLSCYDSHLLLGKDRSVPTNHSVLMAASVDHHATKHPVLSDESHRLANYAPVAHVKRFSHHKANSLIQISPLLQLPHGVQAQRRRTTSCSSPFNTVPACAKYISATATSASTTKSSRRLQTTTSPTLKPNVQARRRYR
jgi:hypothetical protein